VTILRKSVAQVVLVLTILFGYCVIPICLWWEKVYYTCVDFLLIASARQRFSGVYISLLISPCCVDALLFNPYPTNVENRVS
jgi:hypothetical protein